MKRSASILLYIKSSLEKIELQFVSHEDPHPNVKLAFIDQERLLYVFLYHKGRAFDHVWDVPLEVLLDFRQFFPVNIFRKKQLGIQLLRKTGFLQGFLKYFRDVLYIEGLHHLVDGGILFV